MSSIRWLMLLFSAVFILSLIMMMFQGPLRNIKEGNTGELSNHIKNLNHKYAALQATMSLTMAVQDRLKKSNLLLEQQRQKFLQLQVEQPEKVPQVDTDISHPIIPVLVIACSRVEITRTLDLLLKYRPSNRFPIIVSQDCSGLEKATAASNIISERYSDTVILLKQPDQSVPILEKPSHKTFEVYYRIARHYGWALKQVFDILFYDSVIIIEDDMDIAPDFFDLFLATRPLLDQDPTLFCVSAWNDNGKKKFVSDPKKLLRSDFFPGLGWMLTRRTWDGWRSTWPNSFWDDWVREPSQRLGRACIRPEVSRTYTFGKLGASNGQFFDKHLRFINLNTNPVSFTSMDLSFLLKENYDVALKKELLSATTATISQLSPKLLLTEQPILKIEYKDKKEFEQIAKQLDIMIDLKADIPRTGYLGVVTIAYEGATLHIVPKSLK